MFLYLVQHAQSKSEAEDPARPLSAEGQERAARMARLFQRLHPLVAAIWHSDKLRARQTAEALARAFAPPEGLQQVAGLAPLDNPATVAVRLQELAENLMLVGHLPHLSRMASSLLVGDPEKKIIEFQMAGIVCLERDDSGTWFIRWMLPPELGELERDLP